jgi:tetratricopeptide (TPR) repeat protein
LGILSVKPIRESPKRFKNQVIQEFDVSITAVGDDKYLVRTEQVVPGVPLAQEQVSWPIDDWLKQAQFLMHDPLLGLLKGQPNQRWPQRSQYRSGKTDAVKVENVPTLVSFGQSLYNNLFQGLLRDSWLTAQGVAQNRRQLLRLRLGFKDVRLQQLPWEVLHAGDRPLATGTEVTFSRYHSDLRQARVLKPPSLPDFSQPLRILMVIAAPEDQDWLDLRREVYALKEELRAAYPGVQPGTKSLTQSEPYGSTLTTQQPLLEVDVHVLEHPGRTELTQAIERGHYQVVHYAGHSNLGDAGGDLYLVSRQTGLTERLSGEDLAGLLVNNGVKLAVFNSCRGAYSATNESEGDWQEQNLAQALVNRGVPGVIAMAERIPDNVAIAFTQMLYRNLRQNQPIDLCLNRTRQALMSSFGSDQLYWSLPILYLQPSFDGYLLSRPGPPDTALGFAPPTKTVVDPLDQLLFETNQTQPVASANHRQNGASYAEGNGAVSADKDQFAATSQTLPIPDADLDNVVENLDYSDLLRYEDDNAGDEVAIASLIDQLSQPEHDSPQGATNSLMPGELEPGELPLADIDESLDQLDAPLTTPGLSIYDDLDPEPVAKAATPTRDNLTLETLQGLTQKRPQPNLQLDLAPALDEDETAATANIDNRADMASSVEVNTPLPSDQLKHKFWWKQKGKPTMVWGIGGLALAAVLGIGLVDPAGWFESSSSNNAGNSPAPETVVDGLSDEDAKVQYWLAQGDLDAALPAISSMTQAQKFKSASTLLATVNREQQTDARVAFLTGQAQWGNYNQKNTDFAASDVSASWTRAIEAEPDWVEAYVALGFAYYEQGNWSEAQNAWQTAIDRANKARPKFADTLVSLQYNREQFIQNAYAGLTLVALKYAQPDNQDLVTQKAYLDEAQRHYIKVINEGYNDFQMPQLSQNWMWSEKALADWENLPTRLEGIAQ